MISLDIKAEQTVSSPISLPTAKEDATETTSTFSDLLRGAKDSKNTKDDKDIQNGSFVIALDEKKETSKDMKSTLLSLLKGENLGDKDTLAKNLDVLELNPKAIQKLSDSEVRVLINDAKSFLKQEILQSADYKLADAKELPKTLQGLVDMAKKLGVDMSKITLEDVKPAVKESSLEKLASQTLVEEKSKTTDTALVQTKIQIPKSKSKVDTQAFEDTKLQESLKDDIQVSDKKIEKVKQTVEATPLFKASQKTELTTEQIVQTKQLKLEEKTPKSKADETLKLLLRGEKPSQALGNTTADFSVATARVLASTATSEVSKSLETLLHGAPEESTSKLDGLSTHKADSFEVKLNEAKQMVKYLSQDVKTAIEDYKSPFTRVKVQLNPQRMGEVDVTIVQRGKNLHVNISSNTAAINTLAMNVNELKSQLNINGINNASLNFNNNEQSAQQQQQQQQNRNNERQADEEYNYFENEEQNEEVLSSLEIVVPNYA